MKKLSLITFGVCIAICGFSQQIDSTTQPVLSLKQQKKVWKKGVPESTIGFTFAYYTLDLEPKYLQSFNSKPRLFGATVSLARNFTNYFSENSAIYLRMNWFRIGGLRFAGDLALYAGLPSPGVGLLVKTYKTGSVQFGVNFIHGIINTGFEPVQYFVNYLVDFRLTFNSFTLGFEGYVVPAYAKNINGNDERIGLERYIGVVLGAAF